MNGIKRNDGYGFWKRNLPDPTKTSALSSNHRSGPKQWPIALLRNSYNVAPAMYQTDSLANGKVTLQMLAASEVRFFQQRHISLEAR